MTLIEGGCRCGAVHYEIAVDREAAVYACHCRACQRWSGSAFTEHCVVPAEAFSVTGSTIEYEYQTPSGATSTHSACARCFARVYNVNNRLVSMVFVRAGTRDSNAETIPVMHIWVSAKQPWITIPANAAAFEENAPPEEFRRLLGLP